MIVLGADTHGRRGRCGNRRAARVADDPGRRRGFDVLLQWARGLGEERVRALEDWRHVCASLERLLIERGERVLGIVTHLTATARKRSRERGRSDAIDALNVARAGAAGGPRQLPDGAP